jgi:hypothetical protein
MLINVHRPYKMRLGQRGYKAVTVCALQAQNVIGETSNIRSPILAIQPARRCRRVSNRNNITATIYLRAV